MICVQNENINKKIDVKKKKQAKILELKSTVTEMENSPQGLNSRRKIQWTWRQNNWNDQTEEQEIKNEEKWIELRGLMGYHQHKHNESPCREAKGTKILCEEIMDENF